MPETGALSEFIKQRQIFNPEELKQKPNGSILIIDFPQFPISGTQIRQLFANGEDPRELLPAASWQYIQEHRLYR